MTNNNISSRFMTFIRTAYAHTLLLFFAVDHPSVERDRLLDLIFPSSSEESSSFSSSESG